MCRISTCISCKKNDILLHDSRNRGLRVRDRQFVSYFRSEGEDVYRIGQTGVVGAKESRLYIYVRIVNGKIYKLLFGDKDSQPKDINRCHQIVRDFKKRV